MKSLLVSCLLLMAAPMMGQKSTTQILHRDIQIKTALLPLSEDNKEGAMVYGYDAEGKMTVLRKGTNNLVCIADNPMKDGVSVSCYFSQLDPFMARGRELSAQGKTVAEIREIRGNEIASGALKMPGEPSMLYVYYGKSEDYDPKTGSLENGKFRYVIYTPFATVESTGLPAKPHAPGMPWLMDPGTHRAHIMVGPFN
ncbi:hypothetical protein [Arenibacter amylolyticus]|uniref:hypothetical protein n=1 Tax=Arenibacter amylolyticus TaxID=1406873 RepID=UPI000A366595|nr:hypothetical protein [Arenibacter amylolyticus]